MQEDWNSGYDNVHGPAQLAAKLQPSNGLLEGPLVFRLSLLFTPCGNAFLESGFKSSRFGLLVQCARPEQLAVRGQEVGDQRQQVASRAATPRWPGRPPRVRRRSLGPRSREDWQHGDGDRLE